MSEPFDPNQYPALALEDAGLKKELEALLTARAPGNAYSSDGSFSATLATLPVGLRAMAATHCLDISLTLDSITWHFGNFGEPGLVEQTEAGLQELGLHELAMCFSDAKHMMLPLLTHRKVEDCDPYEILERVGRRDEGNEVDRRAWALDNLGRGRSVIYEAWIRYTREHPDRVFAT